MIGSPELVALWHARVHRRVEGARLPSVALATVLLACAPAAQAQAPQVSVQADRSVVAVGEPFWVTVTVQSETGGAVASLPPGSPFEVVQQGGTSSSFQIRSGFGLGTQISRTESIRWQVRALTPGRHLLGPLVVSVGGQQVRAGSTTIDVQAGGAQPQPGGAFPPYPQPGGGLPPQPYPQPLPQPPSPPGSDPRAGSPGALPGRIDPAELDGAVLDAELFLRTVVEPADPFVGQQTVMTVYLYTTVNLANVNVSREPSADGFWAEDLLGPTRRLLFEDQHIGSTLFRVAVLRRVALFPLREGSLRIGAPELEATPSFVSLFSRRAGTLSRRGVEVPVTVQPLPSKGRPDGFEAGNVGRFDVTASLDRASVKVGEPVTYSVTVSGDGNLRNVKVAPVGEVAGARVYEPRLRDALGPRGTEGTVIGGERTWEYLVLPQKAGTLALPEVELVFFDPEAREYRTKRSESLTVEVTGEPGSGGAGPGPDGIGADGGRVAPEELGHLRSIRRRASLSTAGPVLHRTWWFVLLLVLAPALFLGLVVAEHVRDRRRRARDGIRARRAASVARKALAAPAHGSEEGLAEVSRAVHGYLRDRHGLASAGKTTGELEACLAELGIDPELARSTAELLESCERSRYAPSGEGASDSDELARRAAELVVRLDRAPGSKESAAGRGRR